MLANQNKNGGFMPRDIFGDKMRDSSHSSANEITTVFSCVEQIKEVTTPQRGVYNVSGASGRFCKVCTIESKGHQQYANSLRDCEIFRAEFQRFCYITD